MSTVERVRVRVPAGTARFVRGESEEVEHARSRFRSWGKKVEKTFDAKLQ